MRISDKTDSDARWEIPEDLRLRLLTILTGDPAQPATMTYEQFLDWADEDTLAEWVGGRGREPIALQMRMAVGPPS